MKVIFLDVDGVLNTFFSKSRCEGYIGIDKARLRYLKQIIDATGAKVVLSSTWRLGYNRDGGRMERHGVYMSRKFQKMDIRIHSVTPAIEGGFYRGREIKQWMEECPEEIESFVILDDELYDFPDENLTKYHVMTNFDKPDGGLNEEAVNKAIKILNGEAA